jgi:hypothetical protein
MKRVVTQLAFEKFKLAKLQVPPNILESAEGFPFKFEIRKRMV